MGLYSIVFLGSTPIGAPLVGWIASIAGPRVGMAIGGVAALVAAAVAAIAYRRLDAVVRSGPAPDPSEAPVPEDPHAPPTGPSPRTAPSTVSVRATARG